MPKSVEEIMGGILPLLISLSVLIAVSEGGAILCKSSRKYNPRDHRNVYASALAARSLRSDESSNIKSDYDNLNDESPRKESLRDQILRAMLMADSEDSNYRAEDSQNDYSALEASLRADMLRDEKRRNEDEWTRRYIRSNRQVRYDNNQYENYDDDNN